ncbi:MAG: bifunctional 4-hydroxy-2-oxoglutarate aldolase/2-dehydro-3-deoxy-phosphogluconate aldolase [Clostridia bacterium]|jgi:2-dehydro-3-deoxyphosphogluconate aldolase/(4S)-4-hydroxy-2-oxoglutarate aldolase|nr:bifunctional 4-hydroxy-2-oxoglutarate aldolase/2-dehydro-3-deoxy-phosphogluconate aldolase [Clostridia bacterium]
MDVKVVPVVVINDIEETIPTLSAMCEGNLPVAEITFRTACAEEAIKLGVKTFPDMYIGAGTVINLDQCKKAINAGAKFIVSPGLSEEVAKYCKKKGVTYYPGCVTPTEIMKAIELGIEVVKFFPANVYGGLKAIKALAGPFKQIKFLPTGGVSLENLKEFLDYDKIFAVGGSWMMKGDIKANCLAIDKVIKGE